ncbi:ABC transporter permease [Enhydrobacter sp.]|jgi:putative spermidine/putrescine transport system permease protein|uniref:ABC transporter permease n=1 Tax=Enhydrobacter sp. TaxID=1894999 RepID=UPI00260C4FDD|nr:ABC transporter permease [Enhydrobacter sp.]WIM11270.1 MAG: spermidine putrescine ABC transporter permease component PotB [Enhydrobacter sp.]
MTTRREGLTAAALIGPATIFVAVSLFGPLAILFRYSLNDFDKATKTMIAALTPANYLRFFTDPYYTSALATTVEVALLSTAVCLVLGFPLAYVVARTQSRFKHLLIIAIVLPLFVGNAVRAAGWMVIFGNKGFVNVGLAWLGLTDRPIEIMFTEKAVIIGIIAVTLPFMVLSLQSVIEGVDRAVEEAAFSLGAPPLAMFRRVLWPLALPGVLAGTILTFILCMNAYATPYLLGGPVFKMMAPLVYNTFTQQANWPFGGAIAFVLMAVTLTLTVAANLLIQRRTRS